MTSVLEADVDIAEALPLDPFGSCPQWASRIPGLGGAAMPPDPSYVFTTLDTRPGIGTIRVALQFIHLKASRGTLLIEVRARSAFPGAKASRVQTIVLDLRELAAAEGKYELNIESRLNTYYSLAGYINDETDISCMAISIIVDRRATPAEHGRSWGWRVGQRSPAKRGPLSRAGLVSRSVTDLEAPRLSQPMSQIATPEQCGEPAFINAMKSLRREAEASPDNWSLAYVMAAVETYSAGPSAMLGFVSDRSPLASYFAAEGNEILLSRHHLDDGEPIDPGLELERVRIPELCEESRFFAHAHYTSCDVRHPPESFRDRFDVSWSIGANRLMTPAEFVYFAVNGLACVRPGGLAVHVFDFVEERTDATANSLIRTEVERLAILALSHRNDVARLKFRHGGSMPIVEPWPFGIILLRGTA